MSNKIESHVVKCHGCGGSGKQGPYTPLGFPTDCGVCGGTGLVRIQPQDSWCGRCEGTGKERAGIPGFQSMRRCHICGGVGVIQV